MIYLSGEEVNIGDHVYFSKGQGRDIYIGEVIKLRLEKVQVRELAHEESLQYIFDDQKFYIIPKFLIKKVV